MLDTFRKASKSWIAKILFSLLALSFVAWGVGDVVRGIGSGRPAIEVGHTSVSANEVTAEFKRELERLQPMFGGKLTAEDARKLGLLDRTVDQIVTRTLIDEAARGLDLAAGDDSILKQVTANPAFHDERGQFDRGRFQAALARAGYSEKSFLKTERANLMRSQLGSALTGGVAAPATLVEPLVRHREERRVAEAIQIPDTAIPAPSAPEPAVLEQYHKDNAARFMAPEYRALTVLLLRPADMAGEVPVTPEMIAEAYNSRADEFNVPERREVSQVVLDDAASAAKAADMVAAGKDLAAIAQALGGSVVDLGLIDKRDLPGDLAGPVFSQQANSVAAPVRTGLGYHVVKVSAVQPGRSRPLAEVKGQIEQDLRREKALDLLTELANKVEDALGGGATLEEAAKRFSLQLIKVSAVDAQGRGPDNAAAHGLPKDEHVLDTAFRTDPNTESPLTEMGGDGFFLVRVDGVTPPQPKAFAEVKAEVLAAWMAERRHAAARERADKLAEQMKAGEPAARLAQANGLKLQTTPAFTREGAEAGGLPPTVVAEMFRAQVGGVAVGAYQGGHVVARLARVVPWDPAGDATAAEAARARIAQAVSNDIVDQFVSALNAAIGVKIDRSQINRDDAP